MPVPDQAIVMKVSTHFPPTGHSLPGDEIEPHFISEHVAYGVEVACIEAVDINGKT